MKFLIASDIHGSAFYCKMLMDRINDEKADRVLLLGDILYHGPRNDLPKDYDPKAVIDMLNSIKDMIFCVRGNCDTEVDQMVLKFPILADYAVIPLGQRLIYATHGHIFNEENLPPMEDMQFLEVHFPWNRMFEARFAIEPPFDFKTYMEEHRAT